MTRTFVEDTQGFPIVEASKETSTVHRSAVTVEDTLAENDPDNDGSSGLDASGYRVATFDIKIAGVDFEEILLVLARWNPIAGLWFHDVKESWDKGFFTEVGTYSIQVEVRAGLVFMKVVNFVGTSFQVDVWVALS